METTGFRFTIGDRVKVKLDNPLGNPRTPRYIRGKDGVIAEIHGVIYNPRDHRDIYPPLYRVKFPVREVFGTFSDDSLWIDLHEEWLEKTTTA